MHRPVIVGLLLFAGGIAFVPEEASAQRGGCRYTWTEGGKRRQGDCIPGYIARKNFDWMNKRHPHLQYKLDCKSCGKKRPPTS